MRWRILASLIGLLIAAVLTLAVVGLRYERNRVMGAFADAQRETARQLVSDLGKDLARLGDDAHLVTTLLSRARTRPSFDVTEEDSFLLAGFQALATVVRHYRAIFLYRRDLVAVRAIDPAEAGAPADAFLRWSVSAARDAIRTRDNVFEGPREGPGGRQFFVYARPAGRLEAVVLVSEARFLLQPVLRARSPFLHFLLVDPNRSVWAGCKQPETCGAFTRGQWARVPGLAALVGAFGESRGLTWNADLVPAALGLPARPAAIAWDSLTHAGGRWIMAAVASAQAIEARERALLRWLVIFSFGLCAALSAVGVFIVRHLRRAAVLAERLRLEKQLVHAEKLVTVGILTAGLAHEIGTPLGIIRGRAELLLGKVSDPAVARDVESVVNQIDHIASTIRQALDFARTQPVERQPVVVNQAVDAALSILDWRLRQKTLLVRVDQDSDVPSIFADPDQLQQVLVNLLLNACDACDSGGSITVRVRAAASAGQVAIEIEDDGCGIAPEDLNAVFDPYFTTKKRGEGTGLGLPVAASIVRNHQGEITLRSQKGAGSTVTVSWPVAPEEGAAHA